VVPTSDRLPQPRTSFVGRAPQITHAAELLGRARLVTLTGVGGCGKTRLAIEVAHTARATFEEGCVFVDLSGVTEPEQIDAQLAKSLALDLGERASVRERTLEFLSGRHLLIVIDNCEHLLDACAELAEELLDACPKIALLATSREPLHTEGEQVVRVPSMTPGDEAAELFRQRAPVELTGDDQLVERICERLDGIPLAIELAAARTSSLTLSDLADRLDDRFAILTGGRRRVQRQQTLQATIDWSHDLLDHGEARLFRQLGAFAGSFDLRAVETVWRVDAPTALDAMQALVDRSLVDFDPRTGRYRLLESMRLYAEQKLFEAGETESVRERHRDWFLAQLTALPPEDTFLQSDTSSDLLDDLDELRAALRWSSRIGDWGIVGRLASRLVGTWVWLDPREGLDWMEQALSHLEDGEARFECLAGWIMLDRYAPTPPGDDTVEHYRVRVERHREAIAQARVRTDGLSTFVLAIGANSLVAEWFATGHQSLQRQATSLIEEAVRRAEDPDLRLAPAWCGSAWYFWALMGDSELDTAAAALRRAIDLFEDDRHALVGDASAILATVLHLIEAPDAAEVAELAAESATTSSASCVANAMVAMHRVAAGDLAGGGTALRASIAHVDRCPMLQRCEFLTIASRAALCVDDVALAARWSALAPTILPVFGSPFTVEMYRRVAAEVRAKLGREEASRVRALGRALSPGEAIAEISEWADRRLISDLH
jgi:predicted ATPase